VNRPTLTRVCQACGSTLAAHDDVRGQICLGCLLEPGLDSDGPEADLPAGEVRGGAAGSVAAGPRFAHYEIATGADGSCIELGRGAMGITYRAVDTRLHCAVALKVINLDLAAHPRARARFLREAQAAAVLRHPHVASVFFFGEQAESGQLFYAMELAEGETLQARVRRVGGLPVDTALEIAAQVAEALGAAEARGLTHRDLKPANLMLVAGAGVNVKVIDFGLAKAAIADSAATVQNLTRTEEFVGTPAFASPEQFASNEPVDLRSDFYALGATLWYALTGGVPFAGRTPGEIHHLQLQESLPLDQLQAAHVPRPVVELLTSLLSRQPSGRPQTSTELAAALADCRARLAPRNSLARWRAAVPVMGAALLLLALAAGGWLVFQRVRSKPAPLPVAEKSLAVLPFDNLSAEKANAYFTDGVQDEILTDLARVAQLKVISRNSVLGYRDPAKRPPTREIGRALGVAYLLEGSVQREGQHVRVNAQLIDAAADRHVWAQVFDGDLADIFTIQGEIARQIASQLQAKLSGAETAVLEAPPTRDLMAYELYLHAKELIRNFDENTDNWDPIFQAVRLLEETTARDADFLLAWCLLASEDDDLIWYKADPSPGRRAQAEAALDAARRIAPDSGETHLAIAGHYYKLHDPARGRADLALARQKLPNDIRVFFMISATSVIDGRWLEALAATQKARSLDPRRLIVLDQLTARYYALRRYDDARAVANDAIAADIGAKFFKSRLAVYAWQENGDTSQLHEYFHRLDAANTPSGHTTPLRFQTALCDRDFDEAARVLAADPRQEFEAGDRVFLPRALFEADINRARGDLAAARPQYEAARITLEENTQRQPGDAKVWIYLARVDAFLGRREDALREAEHAVSLRPISRDALEGPGVAVDFAVILAQLGEKSEALSLLERLVNVPLAFHYGFLRTHPDWDSLRGEPRFEAVLQAVRAPVDLTKFRPADFPPPP
jgi:TolB-like protein